MSPLFDPCLCIVFNHPFPKNIPLPEKLYRTRFQKIEYIMPFYRDPTISDLIKL